MEKDHLETDPIIIGPNLWWLEDDGTWTHYSVPELDRKHVPQEPEPVELKGDA